MSQMPYSHKAMISPSASGVAYLRSMYEEISGDNLAKHFVTPEGEALAKKWLEALPCVGKEVSLRCKWFDAAMQSAIDSGINQIVQLAAGLSTFPWRHSTLTNLRYAEFDREEMTKCKRQAIGALLDLGTVPKLQYQVEWRAIDFAHDSLEPVFRSLPWAFDQPTLFVLEGISYYLLRERLAALLGEIERNALQGSRIVFDYFHDATEDLPSLERAMGAIAPAGGEATWRRTSADAMQSLLSRWHIMSHESLATIAKREALGTLMDYVAVLAATKV